MTNQINSETTTKPSSEIKSLIISNLAETYYKIYKKSGSEEADRLIKIDFLEGDRAVFYTDDKKIVITSTPLDQVFLHDLREMTGYQLLQDLFPEKPTHSLCQDILKDKILLQKVEKIIRENPGINIIPYYATEEFFDLLSELKHKDLKFSTPETVSAKNRFIRDHYNCKVGFRKLWEKTMDENSFVKIPEGFVVDDLAEGVDAAWWFYQNKKDFVMKYNRGTSGFGVVYYHCEDLPKNEREFKKHLRACHQNRIWFEENFVVEEFIDVDKEFYGGSPSIEFKINGESKYQYSCVQRLGQDSYFEGIIISKQIEEEIDVDLERVVENCMEYSESLEELGYKGIFDIDLVKDKKHNIYAVEANLRRTGGTHLYETAQFLFGRNFDNKIVAASRDNLPVSPNIKSYSDFRKIAFPFYFSREKGEGIIPVIPSFLQIGKIGYFVFGKSVARIQEIEAQLKQNLA